jgi:hypothetical protein
MEAVTFSRFGSIRTTSLPEHDQTAPPPAPIPWHSRSLLVSARTSPLGLFVAGSILVTIPSSRLTQTKPPWEASQSGPTWTGIDASWTSARGVVRSGRSST